MPQSWVQALDAYRYPVKLSDFTDADSYWGWFERDTGSGDRDATAAFEDRFRKVAPQSVVFETFVSRKLVPTG